MPLLAILIPFQTSAFAEIKPLTMKHVIILKGVWSSGKTTILREYLPAAFGYSNAKRAIYYHDWSIWIINRSIHENQQWQNSISRIIDYGYDIYVVAAWADEIVLKSEYVPKRLEDILTEKLPGTFTFHEVITSRRNSNDEIVKDNKRCARKIKEKIDQIVFGSSD
jgi:hypothetical protein